jgi:hypothetical protein
MEKETILLADLIIFQADKQIMNNYFESLDEVVDFFGYLLSRMEALKEATFDDYR